MTSSDIQQHLRKKHAEALSSIIPSHDTKRKQPANLCWSALPYPLKKLTPAVGLEPHPIKSLSGWNPRHLPWNKGQPPNLHKGSAPVWKKASVVLI